MSGIPNIPVPKNEPVLSYLPGSPERAALKSMLGRVGAETIEIPLVIGGREIRTGRTEPVTSPHCHQRVLARVHQADRAQIGQAVDAALEAQREWAHWRFEDRAAVFLKAAELLATSRRQLINAATMHGQSKTAFQAEIDAACELIDFLRFNVHYAERIYREQPESSPGIWNRLDHRPLEGFVYAVTPFNFTAIGGNIAAAPALMGNVVVWKPAPDGEPQQLVRVQAAGGGGAPAGRHQLRGGRSDRGQRRPALPPHARGNPLHRLHRGLPEAVAAVGRRTSRATPAIPGSSARPAARTSSSPTRAPTWTASSRR